MSRQAVRTRVAKAQPRSLGDLLKAVCKDALKKNGYVLETASAREGEHFEFRLRAVPAARAGAARRPAEPDPYPEELRGRQFQLGGRTLIFLGIDPDSTEHPVTVEDTEDGSRGGLRDTPTLRMALRAAAMTQDARTQGTHAA